MTYQLIITWYDNVFERISKYVLRLIKSVHFSCRNFSISIQIVPLEMTMAG